MSAPAPNLTGFWIMVPTGDSRYCPGLIIAYERDAKVRRDSGAAWAIFLAISLVSMSTPGNLDQLFKSEPHFHLMFSCMGLRDGNWIVVDKKSEIDLDSLLLPPMYRYARVIQESGEFKDSYNIDIFDRDNIRQPKSSRRSSREEVRALGAYPGWLAGSGAAESILRRISNGEKPDFDV